jgi:hypothetical protein
LTATPPAPPSSKSRGALRGDLIRFFVRHPSSPSPASAPSPSWTSVNNGRLALRLGDRELIAGRGDVATVEPGTPHRFWNAGQDEARFLCEIRPALDFESLIETMFTLAAEGKTNRKGMPNPLRLAVIARSHFDTVRLPFPPAALQRAALAIGAPLGRMLGYQATAIGAPA